MSNFVGYVDLGNDLEIVLATINGSRVPTEPDAAPSYRVYGTSGVLANGTGSASAKHTFSVSDAANATPIVITTTAAHNLSTGQKVVISGVGGNTNANGTFTITKVDATSFSLDGSSGNGAYTSGGTGQVVGLYKLTHTIAAADGFASGQTYTVSVDYKISGTNYTQTFTFTVP